MRVAKLITKSLDYAETVSKQIEMFQYTWVVVPSFMETFKDSLQVSKKEGTTTHVYWNISICLDTVSA